MRNVLASLCIVALLGPGAAAQAATPQTDGALVDAQSDGNIIEFKPGTIEPAQPRRAEPTMSGNPLWSVPLGSLTYTKSRPIFSPSRRPPPAAGSAPLTAVIASRPEPEQFTLGLIGTIGSDQGGIAIFVEQSSREIVRLRPGEAYRGWVLREVRNREVSVEKDSLIQIVTIPKPD